MRRFRRDQGGQMIPLTLILLLVFVIFAMGLLGIGIGVWTRARVQLAADAGTLAGAQWAQPYATLNVTTATETCTWHENSLQQWWEQCSGYTTNTVSVQGFWSDLMSGGSLPGWAAQAGCAFVGTPQNTSGTGCVSWHLATWGWYFPSGSDPTAAAVSWAEANLARLTANGDTPVSVLSVSAAQDGTGTVSMELRATESWNPLSAVLGHPMTVTVWSSSAPHLRGPLQSSGS